MPSPPCCHREAIRAPVLRTNRTVRLPPALPPGSPGCDRASPPRKVQLLFQRGAASPLSPCASARLLDPYRHQNGPAAEASAGAQPSSAVGEPPRSCQGRGRCPPSWLRLWRWCLSPADTTVTCSPAASLRAQQGPQLCGKNGGSHQSGRVTPERRVQAGSPHSPGTVPLLRRTVGIWVFPAGLTAFLLLFTRAGPQAAQAGTAEPGWSRGEALPACSQPSPSRAGPWLQTGRN